MNLNQLYETVIRALVKAIVEVHDYTYYEIYGNPSGIHRLDIYTYLNRYEIFDSVNNQIILPKYDC